MPSFFDRLVNRTPRDRRENVREEPSRGRRLMDSFLSRIRNSQSSLSSGRNLREEFADNAPSAAEGTNATGRNRSFLERVTDNVNRVLTRSTPSGVRERLTNLLERLQGDGREPEPPSEREVINAIDRLSTESRANLRQLGEALRDGELSPEEFREAMAENIRRIHFAAGIAGSGGIGNLSPEVSEQIQANIEEQLQYLDNFVEDVEEAIDRGDELGRVPARAGMYGNAVRTTHSQAQRQMVANESLEEGEQQERRVLNPADHCPDCFVAGTPVLCKAGWKRIEEVTTSDEVMTLHGWRSVEATMNRPAYDLYIIEAGDRKVVCTGNHPFLCEDNEWVEAKNLRAGQKVVCLQDIPDVIRGNITLPNSLDFVPASHDIGVLGNVSFMLLELTVAKRLEPGVSMPVVAIDFYNQVLNLNITKKLTAKLELGFVFYTKIIKYLMDFFLCATNKVVLTDDSTLGQLLAKEIVTIHSALAASFLIFVRAFYAGINLSGSFMNNLVVGVFGQGGIQGTSPSRDFSGVYLKMFRAKFGSLFGVVGSNVFVLLFGPNMVTVAGAARGDAFPDSLAARAVVPFSDGVFGELAGFTLFGFPGHRRAALAKLVILVVSMTKVLRAWLTAFFAGIRMRWISAGFAHLTLHGFDAATSAPIVVLPATSTKNRWVKPFDRVRAFFANHDGPVITYNLEVDEHHHYITNGIVVHNCINYASQGWQPLGTLPAIGQASQCRTNCRCEFEYRSVQNDGEVIESPVRSERIEE